MAMNNTPRPKNASSSPRRVEQSAQQSYGIDIDEVIRVPVGDKSACQDIGHVEDGKCEPADGVAPAKRELRNKENPEGDVEDGDDVVQQDVGNLLRALRIPQLAEQQAVGTPTMVM